MSPQQTALSACCRRSVWWANPIASPLSRTRKAASAAPDDVEDSVPRSSTSEAAPDELCDVEDSVPISSTSEAAPDELCDVEDSDPISSTSEAAPDELCDVEDSVPFSTGEAAPTGSVPHSEPIVSTVRHVTGTGSGLLGGIPRVVVQISALTLKGPL